MCKYYICKILLGTIYLSNKVTVLIYGIIFTIVVVNIHKGNSCSCIVTFFTFVVNSSGTIKWIIAICNKIIKTMCCLVLCIHRNYTYLACIKFTIKRKLLWILWREVMLCHVSSKLSFSIRPVTMLFIERSIPICSINYDTICKRFPFQCSHP